MFNNLNPNSIPVIASIGFNDGANKGFWRIQPRDDEGQWIEMGADVLFRFRTGSGNLVVATDKGIYVGPSGRPGMARVMIPKDTESGLKAGVYEVESRNLQQFKAILPTGKGTGAGTRKDKFGRPVKTLEDSKLPALENLLADRKDITPEDERLAKGELTPEEKEAEQDGRAKSPVADLPAGFEAENPDKVKELLRESGIDPDEFDKSKKPKAAGKFDAASASDEELKEQLSKDMTDPNWSSAVKEWSKRYNPNHTDFMASSPDFSVPEGTKRTGVRQYGGAWDANDYVMGPNGYWQTAGQQETSKSIKPNKIQEGMVVKNPDGTTKTAVKVTKTKRSEPSDKAGRKPSTKERTVVEFDDGSSDEWNTTNGQLGFGFEDSNYDVVEPATKPAVPSTKDFDPADSLAQEILADVAFNGEPSDSVDSLLEKNKGLIAFRETPTTKKVPFDLERGDIILGDDGEERVVVDFELGSIPQNIPARVRVQKADGSIEELPVDMRDKVNVVSNRRGAIKRPQAPARPRDAAPATPTEAPSTVDPEIVEPGELDVQDGISVVMTDEGLAPANFPPEDRLDDGSNFDLPTLTDEELAAARRMSLSPLLDPDGTPAKYVDENGNLVDAEDPFAMLAALAKVYPNAKFGPDGSLILHRQVDTKSGKIFELRASNSGKRAIVYSFRFYNPGNPEDYVEYQHKDDRHSATALFSEANGPEGLLDRLIGRVDRNGKNWGLPENFKFGNTKYKASDSLFKRSKWFRSGTGDRKKMEEIGDNAVRLAQGRAAVLEKRTNRIKNSAIPSLWEAFDEFYKSGSNSEERDLELRDMFYQTLYGVFGRIPLGEKSHADARKAIRAEFSRQFPGSSARMERAFNGYITSASERMRGLYRGTDPQVRSIKYASKDRTRTIERGMTVEYTNNVGQTSILKVTDLVENTTSNPNDRDSYDYGDNVIVTDANGNKRRINAIKLKIMLSQGTPLTAYRPNLLGEELSRARIESGLAEAPSSSRPNPVVGTDTVISDQAPPPMLADDFIVGEMLYSRADGSPLGIIKAIRPVTSRNGSQGLAFLYTSPDGTENQIVYALGTKITPKKV